MKFFIVLVVLATAAAAGVTSNEREQAPITGSVPENKEVNLPHVELNVPDVLDKTELNVPNLPEDTELDVPDLPEDTELNVPNLPEDTELNVPNLPEDTELDVSENEIGEDDEETSVATRNNLSLGNFGANDRLMSRITHNVAAATLLIHDQEVTFRGARGTNITAIRVNQVGTNSPIATRVAGGLGSEFVTIRLYSARGRAYSYTILVYAAINCSNN